MLKTRKVQLSEDSSELNLTGLQIDDEEEELEITDARELSTLKKLFLNDTTLGHKNSQNLLAFLEKYNFEIISANNCQISDLSAFITDNKILTRLKLSQLNSNNLKDEGILKIAQNNTWSDLRIIRLSKNEIGNDGAIALGKNELWKNLRLFDLSHNQIERAGAMGLAKNNTWSELVEIDLQYNQLDDESTFALGGNSSWRTLERLLIVKGNPGVSSVRRLMLDLNSRASNEFKRELEDSKEKAFEILIDEKEKQFKAGLEQLLADCKDERKEELKRIWDERERSLGKLTMKSKILKTFT